ncbi:MAG: hypothetical protein HC900_08685, partial [Methylacidiphilales bacterium]|nr:hypothetical protein [Candidatus Methylacidiphilales bacterium]
MTASDVSIANGAPRAETGADPATHPRHAKYERLIALAKEQPPVTTVVAHPCDETSLR